MPGKTASGESLEKVLRDSYSFFGDLTDRVRDELDQTDGNYSSSDKKEEIAQFYRKKLSSYGKGDIDAAEKKIRRKARNIAVRPESIARFCLTEKMSRKATLLIDRDRKLLKTVRTEEKKREDLTNSSMLRMFIRSSKDDVYNMKDQLTQYRYSVHGFEALVQLADRFDLDDEAHEAAEDLKEKAEERANQAEEIIEQGEDNPEKAIEELKGLADSFKTDSQEITDTVNDLREAEKDS
jgi:hypothetical protein